MWNPYKKGSGIRKLIRSWYRNVKSGMTNLIDWAPVIWADRDWDHYFLLSILEKKISRMENYFKNSNICVANVKTAKQLKTCRILLQRLINEDYYKELFFVSKTYRPGKNDYDKDKLNHSEMMYNQDLNYLLKIFGKHLRGWWD